MWGEVHPDPVRTAGLQGEVCGLPLLHPRVRPSAKGF